jgi:hypothetical protein
MGISPTEFLSRYGSQSGRNGRASASSNAGIPLELWGQHGGWKSAATQRCYMQKDAPSILLVSQAAMGQHIPAPVPRGALPPIIRKRFVSSTPPVEEVAYSI